MVLNISISFIYIVSNVLVMPKDDSRKAYSVYLSPKAAGVLEEFNRNSGFGSCSRTFEEVLLAYNDVYEIIKAFDFSSIPRQLLDSPDNPLSAIVSLPIIIALKQAINRLKKGLTAEEQIERYEKAKTLQEELAKNH